mmetsp:Transcript_35994/g.58889  ORF Transcript_35994/g.58889 Transcript_35994/m.58889 type:complete len:193 (+) Transcript_35994:1-579(+)
MRQITAGTNSRKSSDASKDSRRQRVPTTESEEPSFLERESEKGHGISNGSNLRLMHDSSSSSSGEGCSSRQNLLRDSSRRERSGNSSTREHKVQGSFPAGQECRPRCLAEGIEHPSQAALLMRVDSFKSDIFDGHEESPSEDDHDHRSPLTKSKRSKKKKGAYMLSNSSTKASLDDSHSGVLNKKRSFFDKS